MKKLVSEGDFYKAKDLLRELGGQIEELLPNVRGQSGTALGKAEHLASEAYRMSTRLNELSTDVTDDLHKYINLRQLTYEYSRLVLNSKDCISDFNYYRDLGLLLDFIEYCFIRLGNQINEGAQTD